MKRILITGFCWILIASALSLFTGCASTYTTRSGAMITVVDSEGQPVEGVEVVLSFKTKNAILPTMHEIYEPMTVVTNAQGKATLASLKAASPDTSLVDFVSYKTAGIQRIEVKLGEQLLFDSGLRYGLWTNDRTDELELRPNDFWEQEPNFIIKLSPDAKLPCGC
ncbi:hypothetical protein QEH59_17970 [Coraliomargarita sp. SDUM461004]|uniref:Carboxypeptidase regulatory-like domain-containing protein n=1 Tax=Thalassobacterium sedimentorum TaxID=3041258 RepID=A0ABU1ARU7_9BACT|nr:hypothetical protein [Coraliomargarita sp. SDUM461004]MDQ8196328.1 hypothetical protein [Coraliomargarita sp. SDUM461004]